MSVLYVNRLRNIKAQLERARERQEECLLKLGWKKIGDDTWRKSFPLVIHVEDFQTAIDVELDNAD